MAKKSDVGQASVPVAVVVAEPVKNTKGKIRVKAEEIGNGAKAPETATERSLSRSLSWTTLLFPALSLLAGVVAPPLRYYVSASFRNEMIVPSARTHNQDYLSRYVWSMFLFMFRFPLSCYQVQRYSYSMYHALCILGVL